MSTSRRAFLTGVAACAVAPAVLPEKGIRVLIARPEALVGPLRPWQVQLRELILTYETGADLVLVAIETGDLHVQVHPRCSDAEHEFFRYITRRD